MKCCLVADLPGMVDKIERLAILAGMEGFKVTNRRAADCWELAMAPSLSTSDCRENALYVAVERMMALSNLKNEHVRQSLNMVAASPTLGGGESPSDNVVEDQFVANNNDSEEKAQYCMKVVFLILLSDPIGELICTYCNLEGFDFLPILLRNSFTNVAKHCGRIIWKGQGNECAYVFGKTMKDVNIKSLCGVVEKLITSASSRDRKQFNMMTLMLKLTENNANLLSWEY